MYSEDPSRRGLGACLLRTAVAAAADALSAASSLIPCTLPLASPSMQRARKVYLLLKKEADAEWRFLKG